MIGLQLKTPPEIEQDEYDPNNNNDELENKLEHPIL